MVRVTSEVGRLKRVLVHAPEAEVDRMVPAMMEELLFDDILYGERAREEHAMFRRVLQLFDIEVIEAREWLAASLETPESRQSVLQRLGDGLSATTREAILSASAAELAADLVRGVRAAEATDAFEAHELYDLPPIPNWCFQRDPLVVVGDGIVLPAMAAPARAREAVLTRVLFGHHPELSGVPVRFDAEASGDEASRVEASRGPSPRLEGGDVLVLSREILAVGHSERTGKDTIEAMARSLARNPGDLRYVIVVRIPKRRAYMHLDTLLTPIDAEACLAFTPVITGRGPEAASVEVLDLADPDPSPRPTEGRLLDVLSELGMTMEPIPCGGSDAVTQQREQWTDGANALALAPGVIALYDRNVATAEELGRHGFRVVHAEDVLLGREPLDPNDPGRLCILVPSHEISRARGGPHCLSHPLVREDLP